MRYLKIAERDNASFSGRILEKNPIFLYVKDYQNAVQKRSFISFRYFLEYFSAVIEVFDKHPSKEFGEIMKEIQLKNFTILIFKHRSPTISII